MSGECPQELSVYLSVDSPACSTEGRRVVMSIMRKYCVKLVDNGANSFCHMHMYSKLCITDL